MSRPNFPTCEFHRPLTQVAERRCQRVGKPSVHVGAGASTNDDFCRDRWKWEAGIEERLAEPPPDGRRAATAEDARPSITLARAVSEFDRPTPSYRSLAAIDPPANELTWF
jgi:hypothetical protein